MTRPAIAIKISTVVLIVTQLVSLTGCQEVAGKVQPPVQVTLMPYLFVSGYYVNVTNLSETALTNVTVTYLWQGNTRSQTVGTLAPRESKTIDPADAHFTVKKNEQIRVSASGYVPKTIDTNTLVDQ